MTPLLVLLFGFHPATAVGTDLLYASVTKTAGTVVHGKRETVDWRIVGGLAFGSVPAAIATLCTMAYFGVKSAHSAFLLNVLLGSELLTTDRMPLPVFVMLVTGAAAVNWSMLLITSELVTPNVTLPRIEMGPMMIDVPLSLVIVAEFVTLRILFNGLRLRLNRSRVAALRM